MTDGYPLVMQLAGKRCVVVGGGAVAARKIAGLLRAGAVVAVVAPEFCPEIEWLTSGGDESTCRGTLHVEQRPFVPSDLDGAALAFAATDIRAVNQAVADAAQSRGIPVNVADDPTTCDFTVPATIQRRGITLAISTGGRSPAFARFLREVLETTYTEDRFMLLEVLTELRPELRRSGIKVDSSTWKRAMTDDLVAEALKSGNRDSARQRLLDVFTAEQ